MANHSKRKSFWAKSRIAVTCMFFLSPLVIIASYFLVKHGLISSDTVYTYIILPYAVIVIVGSYFTAYMVKRYPDSPAISADKTTGGSISENSSPESPVEPKKPIFERYDTYIACPGCGSLVPKGIKQCACGYDLSSPAARIGRRLRRAVPILLCLLLIIAGTAIGYYAGQKSMDSELEKQYALGYESGHDIGYNDGYSVGKQLGYDAGYSAAKMDNSKPNLFSSSSDPSMPRLSGGKLVPIK